MERISLTAFFPAYNDQHTIEGIVRTAAEEMHKLTDDFEVLVVDDGSKDKTGEILDRLAAELPFLRVIHHGRNLGYEPRSYRDSPTLARISSFIPMATGNTTCVKCTICLLASTPTYSS